LAPVVPVGCLEGLAGILAAGGVGGAEPVGLGAGLEVRQLPDRRPASPPVLPDLLEQLHTRPRHPDLHAEQRRDDQIQGGATIRDDTPAHPSGAITTQAGPKFTTAEGQPGPIQVTTLTPPSRPRLGQMGTFTEHSGVLTRSFVLLEGPPHPVTPPRSTCRQTVTSPGKPDTRTHNSRNFRVVGICL
jgi:hypothetical protein